MAMIFRVYWEEAALVTVRSAPSARVVGSTTGNTARKTAAAPAMRNTALPAKLAPSRPARAKAQDSTAPSTASPVSAQVRPTPSRTWTSRTHPARGSRPTGSRRTRVRWARSCTGPEVFRARKASPWTRAKPRKPRPPSTAGQVSHAKAPPIRSPFASSGRPVVVRARAAPMRKAIAPEETARIPFQVRAHRAEEPLPRYSMDTARRISASSSRVSGRYRAENRAPYQNGKAAKVAAPAVTSQTSLPSQTGPMVFSSSRRSFSSRAKMRPMSIPTPRSKPSRTR